MADRYIELLPGVGTPDATGSGNLPADVRMEVMSATQATDTPKLTQEVADFDASQDETVTFQFRMPDDYTSGGELRFLFKNMTVQTGGVARKVRFKAGQKSRGAGDVQDPAQGTNVAFENNDGVSVTLDVNQALYTIKGGTLGLTMTGAAAGKQLVGFFGRNQDHTDDDAAGDARLIALTFVYTA